MNDPGAIIAVVVIVLSLLFLYGLIFAMLREDWKKENDGE